MAFSELDEGETQKNCKPSNVAFEDITISKMLFRAINNTWPALLNSLLTSYCPFITLCKFLLMQIIKKLSWW
jgi:hypothetical protein